MWLGRQFGRVLLDLVTELRSLGWTRLVVLASSDDPYAVRSAFQAGAQAYLLKSASPAVVTDGVKRVLDGGVYAALTWIAIAERSAPVELAATFDAAARARDEALAFIRDRLKRRRAVQGWEVDHAARDFLTRGGLDSHAIHRTGHSLDTDLQGSGTDLDDLEVKDKRALVVGTGFTVGPGLYYPGELGVRAEVSVFLGKDGLEVTTPVQDQVETLVGK